MHFERFRELRLALPAQARVGYVTDAAGAPFRKSASDVIRTQFSILPAVITMDPTHEWVVGNFRDPKLVESVCRRHRLEIVRDFGEGVFLLRRTR